MWVRGLWRERRVVPVHPCTGQHGPVPPGAFCSLGSYTLQYYTGNHGGRWAFIKAKDGPLFWRVGRRAAPAAAFAELAAAVPPALAASRIRQWTGLAACPQAPPEPPADW